MEKNYDINLGWGWVDESIEDYSIIIELESIKHEPPRNVINPKVGDVPFGITCTGPIINHDSLNGKKVKLILPDDEVDSLMIGDKLKLGVINDDTCISAVKL